ncbi:MAG: hypothetical protein MH252_21170 [Thermosynechococcaceae cyanobacterium MS004]|nr:hypothetical protein [Thermosynechococcaceae cyanobacterium MS004]
MFRQLAFQPFQRLILVRQPLVKLPSIRQLDGLSISSGSATPPESGKLHHNCTRNLLF